jgi:hypothetical protein
MTEPLLLDRFVPTWDHEISVCRVFRAPPAAVFDAVTNLDLVRLPVARVLLEARSAGAARRRSGPAPWRDGRDGAADVSGARPGRPRVDPAGGVARHRLVYGAVGKPWKGTGGSPPEPPVTAETFAAFAEPGFAKIAESTVVTPYGAGACVLTMESRVALTGDDKPAPVPALLASGRAVHPADAPDRDAGPGAAVASSPARC